MIPRGYLLAVLLFYSGFNYAQPTTATKDKSFDVLVFTQSWPTIVCNKWKEKNPSHKCAMPSDPNEWSIHGIWPTKFGTLGPSYCNSSAHFDPEAVRPIETELINHWTSIAGTSTYALWAHEWTKHGTCAAQLDVFNSEFKYFSKGLEFFKTYNLKNILSEADIVPSTTQSYDVVDIVNAIRVRLGVNPGVTCRKESGKSKLMEIRICFSKKFELVDCDGTVDSLSTDNVLTNCDRVQKVLYEPYSNFLNQHARDNYTIKVLRDERVCKDSAKIA